MSRDLVKLEITPKLLDFGTSAIAVDQIVRVGVFIHRPLSSIGLLLLLAAAGVLGREAMRSERLLELPANGSVMLWAACALAALGIFALFYARRRLQIATSDGAKLALPATDSKFAHAVLASIRDAMAADPISPLHVLVDFSSKTIDRTATKDRAGVAAQHREVARPLRATEEWSRQPRETASLAGATPVAAASTRARPASARTSPALNGASKNAPETNSGLEPIERRLDALATSAPMKETGTTGEQALRSLAGQGRSTSARSGGPGELTDLIRHVAGADLQHKQALLDLLRVVEDYEKGGPISRDDATAHWRSFSDYVHQYLGNVEGLPDLTRRAGRSTGLGAP